MIVFLMGVDLTVANKPGDVEVVRDIARLPHFVEQSAVAMCQDAIREAGVFGHSAPDNRRKLQPGKLVSGMAEEPEITQIDLVNRSDAGSETTDGFTYDRERVVRMLENGTGYDEVVANPWGVTEEILGRLTDVPKQTGKGIPGLIGRAIEVVTTREVLIDLDSTFGIVVTREAIDQVDRFSAVSKHKQCCAATVAGAEFYDSAVKSVETTVGSVVGDGVFNVGERLVQGEP